MDTQSLEGGFSNPALQSATAFRGVMEAMARPATVHVLQDAQPPAPLSVAAGVVLLTLCDTDTPIYLAGDVDCCAVRDWITFHTGAPICAASDCAYAFGTWEALMPLSVFPIGTSEYPDRSATLVVEMPELRLEGATLTGPGIQDEAHFAVPDVSAFQTNAAQFPLGLDFFFTCGDRLAALPRSTEVR
ncbi:alpha-D-ribose 1-methylphosphonate 5-triphosphate synthase subunit PhnH [Sulfitobacter undariae]|uniref:Alpha-D-ribose 1-methylphosphonate 5-triphosphate synthase subunit PhnH n=1 Tax=Sulfitobacter undariae TaxID=1563671 RepID=A0A7W6E734_9RHOB|nr:phosphonate C-P lyase system protein PhnH [Sulfitobacter undariae]MBB3995424.1 alpha-D-ribose 1-methylphosphonate 5-triphosphate synthase subunit PhnH [Sulfitobacter undariae]